MVSLRGFLYPYSKGKDLLNTFYINHFKLYLIMKKILLLSALAGGIATGAQAQQLPNSSFDTFETGYNQVGEQPTSWKGSNVNQTVKVPLWGNQNKKQQLIWNDQQSVKMVNKFVGVASIGSNAPAYITLGQPWVYAETKINNCDGGTYGGMNFAYRPDAITFKYKRVMGKENPNENAQVIVYSWKGSTSCDTKYQPNIGDATAVTKPLTDRERDILSKPNGGGTKSSDFKLICHTEYTIAAATHTDWQPVTVPLTYQDASQKPEKLNVILSSADYFNKANIGQENELYVDDVKFVYYSQLSALSINGNPIENFDKNTYTYEVNGDYTEGCITATSDGKGASVSTTYDNASRTATITVEGEDIASNSSNKHVYTVKFIEVVKPDYTENLVITINGNSVDPIKQGVFMKEVTPGFYNLSIKDFELKDPNTYLLIGDIVLENVPAKNVNGQLQYEKYQETIITSENPDAFGPDLGKLPISFKGRTINGRLWASLQIDMRSTLGQMIIVTIGDSPTVKGKDVTGVNHNNVVCLNYRMGYQANITEMDKSVTKADLEEVAATQLENCIVYNPSIAGKNVVNTTNNSCELYTLNEKKDGLAIPASFTATAINYDREFTTTANYISSFVLPYSMNVSDVQGEVYEFASVEANMINFKKATMVEANKPYLIVATAANPFKATNVKVEATPAAMETVNGDYAHVGTYTKQEVASDATTTYYGYANGQFVKANTGTLNPFRTMIKATNTAAPATLSLKLDGEVTGIVGVNSELGKVNVYNLEGKLVRSQVAAATALQGLAKGVYVINGKKVVK